MEKSFEFLGKRMITLSSSTPKTEPSAIVPGCSEDLCSCVRAVPSGTDSGEAVPGNSSISDAVPIWTFSPVLLFSVFSTAALASYILASISIDV